MRSRPPEHGPQKVLEDFFYYLDVFTASKPSQDEEIEE